jgi:hypothetical protein
MTTEGETCWQVQKVPGTRWNWGPPSGNRIWADPQEPGVDMFSIDATRPMRLVNLRWEHDNSELRQSSPDTTGPGDDIWLIADSDNVPDRFIVEFCIADKATMHPVNPRCYRSPYEIVSGVLKGGIARAKWTVKKGFNVTGEPQIMFEAQFRLDGGVSKTSATIACSRGESKRAYDFVEIPDLCFHPDSPMPVLDEGGILEAALVASYAYAKQNATKEMLVFGHGEENGVMEDEYDRSKQRAELILCLLDCRKERFGAIAELCATAKDWQTCLATLASRHDWDCDPGKPDGKPGPKTNKATERFKKQCNDKKLLNIAVDSTIDCAAWSAMYAVFCALIEEQYRKKFNNEPLPKITISTTGNGFYACGMSFQPNGVGYRSKSGRRGEIFFFDNGACPALVEHTKKTDPVTTAECPVYDKKLRTAKPVEYTPFEFAGLRIKAVDGPAALAHNQKGAYTVTFNREATVAEKKTVCWVVMIDGKETERHEKAGDRFDFTAVGKYAGEKITVHPFLRSPSDKLCVKTTVGLCLVFDGDELVWLDEAHKEVKKWRAWSGDQTHTDPAKDGGPAPAGRWVVQQTQKQQTPDENWWQQVTNARELSGFSSDKIELLPFKTTETYGRKGFFIHDGKEAGAGHGINLMDKMKEFVDEFGKSGKNLVLVVEVGNSVPIPTTGSLVWGKKVSAEFRSKVIEICARIKINADYLMAAMAFESGESFSPSIQNASGSGAVGLIQFMPSTAKGLGTTTSELSKMTTEQQLDYVEKYFKPHSGKLQTLEDIYMAILWPAAIGKPNDHILFKKGSAAYTQNAGLDIDKDGNITKAEAAGKVREKYERGKAYAA